MSKLMPFDSRIRFMAASSVSAGRLRGLDDDAIRKYAKSLFVDVIPDDLFARFVKALEVALRSN
jgi:hypothetical protein